MRLMTASITAARELSPNTRISSIRKSLMLSMIARLFFHLSQFSFNTTRFVSTRIKIRDTTYWRGANDIVTLNHLESVLFALVGVNYPVNLRICSTPRSFGLSTGLGEVCKTWTKNWSHWQRQLVHNLARLVAFCFFSRLGYRKWNN